MGARASRLGFLGAPWQLSGDLLCFLGTTFGHSSSLRALSGCLLEPNCAPKALQDRSQDDFWPSNLQMSSNFDSKIMRFLIDFNPSNPSHSPVLQSSDHPIIQVGTAECAERLNPPPTEDGAWRAELEDLVDRHTSCLKILHAACFQLAFPLKAF